MSLKGGYQILDLSGYTFNPGDDSKNAYNVPGIYGELTSTRKPILVSGFTIEVDDSVVKFRDFFPYQVTSDDEGVYLDLTNGGVISISKNDIIECS